MYIVYLLLSIQYLSQLNVLSYRKWVTKFALYLSIYAIESERMFVCFMSAACATVHKVKGGHDAIFALWVNEDRNYGKNINDGVHTLIVSRHTPLTYSRLYWRLTSCWRSSSSYMRCRTFERQDAVHQM